MYTYVYIHEYSMYAGIDYLGINVWVRGLYRKIFAWSFVQTEQKRSKVCVEKLRANTFTKSKYQSVCVILPTNQITSSA